MKTSLAQSSQVFLEYLEGWQASLPSLILAETAPLAQKTALLCVDVTNGFCKTGALASPRVGGIVQPVVRLFQAAWHHGINHIVLLNDNHEPDALEFSAFPVHGVRGTTEADPVDEIKNLPFFNHIVIIPKNSVAPGVNTGLAHWMASHPEVDTYIVTGDCTDICTYQLAIHVKTDANSRQVPRRVIVPADCVDTYDRSVETARQEGGFPHPGDLLHSIFLYHMALNGIDIVRDIR